jgi:hypothetical protein
VLGKSFIESARARIAEAKRIAIKKKENQGVKMLLRFRELGGDQNRGADRSLTAFVFLRAMPRWRKFDESVSAGNNNN